MDLVFKALADSSRRSLLDNLFLRDGQTLGELGSRLEMTRFGAMKHLRVLENAGLVTTRKVGREKLHYLNPVPIQEIEQLIEARRAARLSRHFAEADRIRKELDARGILLEDTAAGTRWKRK